MSLDIQKMAQIREQQVQSVRNSIYSLGAQLLTQSYPFILNGSVTLEDAINTAIQTAKVYHISVEKDIKNELNRNNG